MNHTTFALVVGASLALTMGVILAATMLYSNGYAYINKYNEGWIEAIIFFIGGLYILWVIFK